LLLPPPFLYQIPCTFFLTNILLRRCPFASFLFPPLQNPHLRVILDSILRIPTHCTLLSPGCVVTHLSQRAILTDHFQSHDHESSCMHIQTLFKTGMFLCAVDGAFHAITRTCGTFNEAATNRALGPVNSVGIFQGGAVENETKHRLQLACTTTNGQDQSTVQTDGVQQFGVARRGCSKHRALNEPLHTWTHPCIFRTLAASICLSRKSRTNCLSFKPNMSLKCDRTCEAARRDREWNDAGTRDAGQANCSSSIEVCPCIMISVSCSDNRICPAW
jgi:hypothetical protein